MVIIVIEEVIGLIVILEDDENIALGLRFALEKEGYHTGVCRNLQSFCRFIEENHIDMALLDLALPDGSGYDACRAIKRKRADIPVIFLTVDSEEASIVKGLDIGADDYIAKPFRIRELLSRINSVFRRYKANNHPNQNHIIALNGITIDTGSATVTKNSQPLSLTALEYQLLLMLARHYGKLLTRNMLLENLWDIGGEFVNDNTLSVYIKRLREKIEDDPKNPRMIHTVRGLGYKMEESHETT